MIITFIYKKVNEKPGLKTSSYNEVALWAYTDSLLELRPMKPIGKTISPTTSIFKIGENAVISIPKNMINNAIRKYKAGLKPFLKATTPTIKAGINSKLSVYLFIKK